MPLRFLIAGAFYWFWRKLTALAWAELNFNNVKALERATVNSSSFKGAEWSHYP